MKHLIEKKAKAQLRVLKDLPMKALDKRKHKKSGYFRLKPYEWVAFDNRTGNLWIGLWQHKGECLNWLNNDPG